jgi:sugar lactone lactonase YvrE
VGIHRIQVNQTCSNGKVVVPDGTAWSLYDIDTPTQKVVKYRLEVESEFLVGPEDFIDLTAEDHYPDGMRITPDGQSMVIAFFNPANVPHGIARQYSLKDGSVEAEWQVPKSPRVTCPAFVEIDGKVKLMLTTAVEGMPEDELAQQENAGAIFIADTDFESLGPYTPKVAIRHFIDFR